MRSSALPVVPDQGDPYELFQSWYDRAVASGIHQPEAMAVASVIPRGPAASNAVGTAVVEATSFPILQPQVRMVLWKGWVPSSYEGRKAFLWVTHFDSQKGVGFRQHPRGALLFHWDLIGLGEFQVRVEGEVFTVGRDVSESYFQKRPRGSQISAWVSRQSQTLASRSELESRYSQFETEHLGKELNCPERWGGLALVPDCFEFWTAAPHRLHHRHIYSWTGLQWVFSMKEP